MKITPDDISCPPEVDGCYECRYLEDCCKMIRQRYHTHPAAPPNLSVIYRIFPYPEYENT